jgi:hypothetical protein
VARFGAVVWLVAVQPHGFEAIDRV